MQESGGESARNSGNIEAHSEEEQKHPASEVGQESGEDGSVESLLGVEERAKMEIPAEANANDKDDHVEGNSSADEKRSESGEMSSGVMGKGLSR